MIYTWAIPQLKNVNGNVLDSSAQIERFITEVREKTVNPRKVSTSLEEMNTSEESDQISFTERNVITGGPQKTGVMDDPKPGRLTDGVGENVESPESQAERVIKEAELAKARLYEVPGKLDFMLSTAQIDEDYQMIDAHLDDANKSKIQCFEYIDFSKLLAKNHNRNDDQRLEIINRNGMMFLTLAAEKDTVQISSYPRWEQVFCIYSNVITSRFPTKSTELLQYGHSIHSAAMAYQWDNVYTYNREFRHHISCHLTCSWGIILQQAWTMILKDRLKYDSVFQRGQGQYVQNNKSKNEPCHRFNKGRCTYGLSCKFDHRCLVKKCGKFSHGAHICRLRLVEQQQSGNNAEKGDDSESTKK